MPQDPDGAMASIEKKVESASSVRLGRGVLGKTGGVAAIVIVLWIGIVIRITENPWITFPLVIAGLVPTGFAIWWIHRSHRFAEANPSAALLEGAQFVEYQRFEAEAKGFIPRSAAERRPVAGPEPLHAVDSRLVDAPDKREP